MIKASQSATSVDMRLEACRKSKNASCTAYEKSKRKPKPKVLSAVRELVRSKNQHKRLCANSVSLCADKILQSSVLFRVATKNTRGAFSGLVAQASAFYRAAKTMRIMRRCEKLARTPQKRELAGQPVSKFADSVCALPYKASQPRHAAIKIQSSLVAKKKYMFALRQTGGHSQSVSESSSSTVALWRCTSAIKKAASIRARTDVLFMRQENKRSRIVRVPPTAVSAWGLRQKSGSENTASFRQQCASKRQQKRGMT